MVKVLQTKPMRPRGIFGFLRTLNPLESTPLFDHSSSQTKKTSHTGW